MAILDDLDDLFTTPRTRDDKSVAVDGIEELFEKQTDDSLELGDADISFPAKNADHDLLTVPNELAGNGGRSAAPVDIAATPMGELLSSLATDLEALARDIHKLLADDETS